MDFEWTAEHVAFRQRLQQVLSENLPGDWYRKSKLDNSTPYVFEFARTFCPLLAREHLLIPHWPKEVGGEGLDAFHHWILGEEMRAAGEPRGYQYMNVNWIGPAILKYGTPAQIKHHIGGITAGTTFWCQGFSEPNAGSDLAALSTKAVKTSNGWLLNGSKTWTSAACFADYCFLLARTGETKRDISVFLVPMKTKGIDVKVIRGVVGERSLHEVFLTDVEISDETLLGEVSKGWGVIRQVLHNERIGSPRYAIALRAVERSVEILKERGRFNDTGVVARAVRARVACEAANYQSLQVIDARVKRRPPSAKTSVARFAMVLADRALSDFLGDCLYDVAISNEDPIISAAYRRSASSGVGAGTAEIQLNAIARDYLQLPRE